MHRVTFFTLILLLSASVSYASTIETFDTQGDMNTLLDLDVFASDSTTQWRSAGSPEPFSTPSVHFNQFIRIP